MDRTGLSSSCSINVRRWSINETRRDLQVSQASVNKRCPAVVKETSQDPFGESTRCQQRLWVGSLAKTRTGARSLQLCPLDKQHTQGFRALDSPEPRFRGLHHQSLSRVEETVSLSLPCSPQRRRTFIRLLQPKRTCPGRGRKDLPEKLKRRAFLTSLGTLGC